MPALRRRRPAAVILAAVLVAALLGGAFFWLSTEGIQALEGTDPASAPTGNGSLPDFIYNVPDTVRTTADYGPAGPVSVVFAVPAVREGLLGWMDNPWVAVSSRTGDYRALSAPHRPAPAPGAVSVSPAGDALAWGFEDGLVLYDPLTDEAREVRDGIEGDPRVGRFSPDGSLVLVHDTALQVVEVATGEVVGTVDGVDARMVRQAVWTPDGEALTYVTDGALVRRSWTTGVERRVPTTIQPDATLSWSPDGDQLAAMRTVRGVSTVEVYDVAPDGRLRRASVVEQDGYAQQEFFGFVGDTSVAVSALTLQTATLPLAFEMSTVGEARPAELMQLPSSEVSLETLEVATGPLAEGSAPYPEPNWPASDLAKLTGSVVAALFFLGLYLTRRPR
ncbi:MAG TPA: hypothetical protein VFZ64_13770 [Nocardioidaceae bacterium]